jgi:hypothetical protein
MRVVVDSTPAWRPVGQALKDTRPTSGLTSENRDVYEILDKQAAKRIKSL